MFKDLAIIIHTCDKYEFVWEGWYKTFKKHWDFDLGIDIYFTNEEKDVSFDGLKQLKTGKGEWSDRLRTALNSISHKHTLYWQEDMWMKKSLNNFPIYYNDFIKYDMDYLMFMCEQNIENKYFIYDKNGSDDKYLKNDIVNTKWVVNHQPAIWKKEFFLEYLQHSENPWINEIEGTKRAKENHKTKEINSYNVNELNKWYLSVVKKGKFRDSGIRKFKDV